MSKDPNDPEGSAQVTVEDASEQPDARRTPPVKDDGRWKVQIHIGRPGSTDVGKHFEVMAIANPTSNLTSGDKVKAWPTAKWKSQVVEVVRK